MSQLDLLYRALKNYRKETGKDEEYLSFRNALAKAEALEEKLQIEYNVCTVDTDWMDAIEEGLEFIGKAIAESRQFIRSNGEVVPVEKAKHVSKDSVVHLAKHSNLITTEPEEGEDILPEKIYVVERLSDYAVYENRFLYMLLCYLRDFISLRYDKIQGAANTYHGMATVKKSVIYRRRKIEYVTHLTDENRDDPYLSEHNGLQDVLQRMSLIQKTVMHYLSMPLMQETAKAPMLKPPITKTNVLKMNHNFRGAMALYEYIAAYQKEGFTIEKRNQVQSPLHTDVAGEFADDLILASFLTYYRGLGIESELQERYEAEEQRRKEEEEKNLIEQIKKLKKRAQKEAGDMEKYMLLLEKRNKHLEDVEDKYLKMKRLKEELEGKLAEALDEIRLRDERLAQMEKDLLAEKEGRENDRLEYERKTAELLEKHRIEIETLTTRYENEIAELVCKHEEEKAAWIREKEEEKEKLLAEKAAEIESLKQAHEEEKENLRNRYVAEKEELIRKHAEEREKLCNEKDDLRNEIVEKTEAFEEERKVAAKELEKAKEAYEKELWRKEEISARLNALRKEKGLIDGEEFTTEDSFDELEREYEAFTKLFNEKKKTVKKKIRKEVLGNI